MTNFLIRRAKQTESSATVLLERTGGEPTHPAGVIRGPFCQFARTLPANFPLQPLPPLAGRPPAAAATIVDPCYWTPELPFEYELQCEGDAPPQRFAFRRWYAVGAAFQLSGKRTVLRGAAVSSAFARESEDAIAELLQTARDTESALVVPRPPLAFCEQASREGVALVVDLRSDSEAVAHTVPTNLIHCGAVFAAIVTAAQLDDTVDQLRRNGVSIVLTCSVADDPPGAEALARCDALAVELQADEAPPAWLAELSRPVFAIRRGAAAPTMAAARAAADQLQADLAPQFDLAGYFVEVTLQ
ncbi:MAG: hypothetical protein CMJ58_11700 [Planctomycetaceae bacterium]|nr:hypothetical protein [Planctomycetaceae bacterium]